MKKLLSVVLVLTMLVCMFAFTSCEESALATLEKADAALIAAPYTMTMSMNFECDDTTLNTVFDALAIDIPITVDGDNVSMTMQTELMGSTVGIQMTLVDKVLYSATSIMDMDVKMKCTLSETEVTEFKGTNNAELPISYVNFDTLTMEAKDGKQVITCTGITTEGTAALNKLLSDALKALGAEAAMGDMSFVITLADGKYDSMALTVSYSVTVAGETKTVSLTMNASYAYDNVPAISAPADAADYQEVNYNEIIGE